MKIQLEKKHVCSCSSCMSCLSGVCFLTFILIFTVSAGNAWAFDTYHGTLEDPRQGMSDSRHTSLSTESPSPTMADSCLPLLKSIRHVNPNAAMDRNQRSAGKAAALGLVLGVRLALAPSGKTSIQKRSKVRFDLWQPDGAFAGDRQALAISAYRQCQKDKALNALSKFRWVR